MTVHDSFAPDRPWLYPGRPLQEPVVLGIPGVDGREHALLLPRPGRRLGQACVRTHDGDVPLNDTLLTSNVAPVDSRRPVVSFGSNSDPATLRRKLAARGVSCVAPLVPGTLGNARLAASAHVSRPGYIPAGAAGACSERLVVVVAWLDAEQLQCLSDTEPNYHRLVVDDRHHDVLLGHGERLSRATLYDTKHGVLNLDLDLDCLRSQRDLWAAAIAALPDLRRLLDVSSFESEAALHAVMQQLAADDRLRQRAGDVLRASAVPGGLVGDLDGASPLYGDVRSTWTDLVTS